ncbi:MAG: HNH endonuclease signature motif containing protein [Corynebacterium sp.]|nr:HNH endonuclease signature motif containing protein [Corynebacterium sp.]
MLTSTCTLGVGASYEQLQAHAKELYGNTSYKQYVDHMTAEHGLCTSEARTLLFAAKAHAHPRLRKHLIEGNLRFMLVAELVSLARSITDERGRPVDGHVYKTQLDLLAQFMEGVELHNGNSLINIIRARIREHNAEQKRLEDERKRAEYQARLAEGNPEADPLLPVTSHENTVEPVEPIEPETVPDVELGKLPPRVDVDSSKAVPIEAADLSGPKFAWLPEDLEFWVVPERPGYCTLVLKGVAEADAAVVQEGVRRQYSSLSADEQKLPKAKRDGIAAQKILFESMRHSSAMDLIRFNVVVRVDLLEKHPEWAFSHNGKFYSTQEIHELVKHYGDEHALSITDLEGRVMSYSKGRFATEVDRIVWEIHGGKCSMPGCKTCHNLEMHHLEDYKDTKRTETWDVRPVCKPHHEQITRYPGNFQIFDDLCTSVWTDPKSGRAHVDIAVHPTSSTLAALGKSCGLDPLIPKEYEQLRAELVRETYKRLRRFRE